MKDVKITRSSPRGASQRIVATALAAFVVVSAFPCLSAARGDDLNRLLLLLSHDIRLGLVEYARPIDPLWIKDIRGLQPSSDAAFRRSSV